ncbi:MAG: hypothetical protein VYD64_02550, partial [Pseudomonadota bacterium]|nr:hypothetical protein [Pseudomonadota bacterium]
MARATRRRRARRGLPEHVYEETDRHGKTRLRFRTRQFSAQLVAPFPSEEFWQEYRAALEGQRLAKRRIGAKRRKPGSLAALVLSYYQSPEFTGLRPSTKSTYRGILDRFVREHGDKPVRGLQRAHIKAIIGKMDDRPSAANNLLDRLKSILEFALDAEMIDRNPARGIKGFKVRSEGFATW